MNLAWSLEPVLPSFQPQCSRGRHSVSRQVLETCLLPAPVVSTVWQWALLPPGLQCRRLASPHTPLPMTSLQIHLAARMQALFLSHCCPSPKYANLPGWFWPQEPGTSSALCMENVSCGFLLHCLPSTGYSSNGISAESIPLHATLHILLLSAACHIDNWDPSPQRRQARWSRHKVAGSVWLSGCIPTTQQVTRF